jgi:hypothetical protein
MTRLEMYHIIDQINEQRDMSIPEKRKSIKMVTDAFYNNEEIEVIEEPDEYSKFQYIYIEDSEDLEKLVNRQFRRINLKNPMCKRDRSITEKNLVANEVYRMKARPVPPQIEPRPVPPQVETTNSWWFFFIWW